VACDGVSKPRTGGWKTTKNCTDFKQKQIRLCGGSPTATAGDNSQAAPALSRHRGRQQERGQPGLTASGGNSSPGSFSHCTLWEPPEALPKTPAQMETGFRARVIALPRKPFVFSYESANVSFQM